MAQVKGIYTSGTESKKKKTVTTGGQTKSTTAATAKKTTKSATTNVPAQTTNAARQEQLREQQYRSQQSSAGTAKSTAGSNVAGAVATKIQPQSRENTEAAAKVEKSTTGNVPVQTTNDARQEQLREQQYHIRPQTDPQELQRLTAAKKRAEDAWSNWTWEKEYNPNNPTNLEDFYRRAGIRLPPGRVFSGRIPTVEQLYEFVRQGQSEKPSAEAAQRGQELRRKQETETLYANMDREWVREEATHQDIGFAREEQLAARKYQETKEREQKAYDVSTQAVVDEKLAEREYLASRPVPGYIGKEKEEGSFWGRLLNDPYYYSPYQDLWEHTLDRWHTDNQKLEAAARASNHSNREGERVFDESGHINGQAHESIGSMRFGNSNVATSGCGAIAVYNVLQDLGRDDVTLSDIIQTAEKKGYMLAGGVLGIMPNNLKTLMSHYEIKCTEVSPLFLHQNDSTETGQDGQIFIVSAWNDEDNLFAGMHNYEMVYDKNDSQTPWIVYNYYSNSYHAWRFPTLSAVLGKEKGKFKTIYQVEVR